MRRPKRLLLASAVLLSGVIIFWPGRPLEQTSEFMPSSQPSLAPKLSDLGKPADLFHTTERTISTPEIDAANLRKADKLNSPDQSIHDDLQIVADFVDLLSRAGVSVSFGENTDITAALTGTQFAGQKGHVFPRQHNAIRGGQLVDRWGSPFWFHANGPGRLEIRSAGPDRQLFTLDDVIRNPSPAGLGATPPEPAEQQP